MRKTGKSLLISTIAYNSDMGAAMEGRYRV